jgi:hypothetical protein
MVLVIVAVVVNVVAVTAINVIMTAVIANGVIVTWQAGPYPASTCWAS